MFIYIGYWTINIYIIIILCSCLICLIRTNIVHVTCVHVKWVYNVVMTARSGRESKGFPSSINCLSNNEINLYDYIIPHKLEKSRFEAM